MPEGDDHQMAAVVGVAIENGEGSSRPRDDQVAPVRFRAALGGKSTKNTTLRLALLDELHSPRRPERVHGRLRLPARAPHRNSAVGRRYCRPPPPRSPAARATTRWR